VIDWRTVPSPCYVVDLRALRANLRLLADIKARAGCKILLAQKGFSMFSVYPLVREYLDGVCASSPHEARLGREEMDREVHAFAPAYSERDMAELTALCDHIIFNSFSQWRKHRPAFASALRPLSAGLRVNPGYSEVAVALYNPCAPGSRLGIRRPDFEGESLDGIEGLHFHCLCEENADALEHVLAHVEEQFSGFFNRLRWINFGGGHHITRPDYDGERLVRVVKEFRARHPHLEVYLEPGEAIALNTGWLVSTVLDVVRAEDMPVAILDASAAAHMPDVIEMPYRPNVLGAGKGGEKAWTCRLAGHTCLAGDVVGEYSFDAPLKPGDRVVFADMAHYTMVKNTTFNGVRLPSIATWDEEAAGLRIIREFGYEDFKGRLS
jgi:carboxynorspermidine decarboxylase